MKKVILNGTISDLNGKPILLETGKVTLNENNEPVREIVQQKFGRILPDMLIRMGSLTDEQADLLVNLAEKINENMKLETPTEMELSDDEFMVCYQIMAQREAITKARFNAMVKTLNPAE